MNTAKELAAQARKIKLFITDVDGVWTNGKILVHADGSESVSFSVLDGFGIVQVINSGIDVVIISGRENPAVRHRAAKLGVTEIIMGSHDKSPLIEKVINDRGLRTDQVAVIGDDLPDLAMFANSGLCFAPSSAHPTVKAAADIVTSAAGGDGCLREACDFLINSKNN